MPKIVLARRVERDLERILTHLAEYGSTAGSARLALIRAALDILETSPLIGRTTARGHRELIIGRRGTGYVALYRYQPKEDLVLVLAIRAQREAGFRRKRL